MSFLLLDILPLKPGANLDEAIAYFDGLKPVFEKHGLRRVDQPLEAKKSLRGELSADLVNLFETEDPETSLGGMRDDPVYQSKVAERDRIFDLDRASIILTARR